MIEFSAYGENSKLVQELVDEDKDAKGFFEKSFLGGVRYVDEIEKIIFMKCLCGARAKWVCQIVASRFK